MRRVADFENKYQKDDIEGKSLRQWTAGKTLMLKLLQATKLSKHNSRKDHRTLINLSRTI